MRFVLDQDVDARVARLLVKRGHEAWTVADAGMPDAQDDEISAYAAKMSAIVVTHDIEFSARRRRNPHGRHVQLRCREPDALEVIDKRLDELVEALTPFTDAFVLASKDGVEIHLRWT